MNENCIKIYFLNLKPIFYVMIIHNQDHFLIYLSIILIYLSQIMFIYLVLLSSYLNH